MEFENKVIIAQEDYNNPNINIFSIKVKRKSKLMETTKKITKMVY